MAPTTPAAESVSMTDVLDCVSAVFNAAGGSAPTQSPRLVSVLLSERERFTRLLGELFRTAEGVLVDATTCGAGVEAPGDPAVTAPDLVAAVNELLEVHNTRDPAAELRLDTGPGWAVVNGSVDYESANTAQRSLREVASAVFSKDLTAASLTGLVWADDSLDESVASLVWDLLMRLDQLLSLNPGATVVLFAGDAALRPTLHCVGPSSVSFNISSRGLDRRKAFAANESAVRDLARPSRAAAPLIVLFVGAGGSTVDGLPTGNDLRDRALAYQMDLPKVDASNYSSAALAFFDRLRVGGQLRTGEEAAGAQAFVDQLTLERVLQVEQAQEHRRDSETIRRFRGEHKDILEAMAITQAAGGYLNDPLVRLLGAQRRLVLVTVNFDRVIEVKGPNLTRPFVTEADLAEFPGYISDYASGGGQIPLLKLHGDVDIEDSIVANVDETEAGLSKARIAALQGLVATVGSQDIAPWWYVGYSMRDLDLEPIWSNPSFADRMLERWVTPFLDPAVRRFVDRYRSARWAAGGASYTAEERLVSLTAADFFGVLADLALPVWTA